MIRNEQTPLERTVPEATKRLLLQMDRRSFLKSSGAAFLALSVPAGILSGPTPAEGRDARAFSEKQWRVLKHIQSHLWPDDGDGPGVEELRAAEYIQVVVLDKKVDPEHREFIRSGIDWVEEEAIELGKSSTLDFEGEELERLLRHVESYGWGESWLAVVLLYIFEALLADPLYGGNPDQKGWKWLEHYPGYPRPTKETMYKPDIG